MFIDRRKRRKAPTPVAADDPIDILHGCFRFGKKEMANPAEN
jgi:hypothetical protein